jgi:hypothetical protein
MELVSVAPHVTRGETLNNGVGTISYRSACILSHLLSCRGCFRDSRKTHDKTTPSRSPIDRLCRANENLTEACFQKTPLSFATPATHTLRFADLSKDMVINATVVTEGGGLGWMVYPIPPSFAGCDYVAQPPNHCNYTCPGCGPPK